MMLVFVYAIGFIAATIILALCFRHDESCKFARDDILLIVMLASVWPVLILHTIILASDRLVLEIAALRHARRIKRKWTSRIKLVK